MPIGSLASRACPSHHTQGTSIVSVGSLVCPPRLARRCILDSILSHSSPSRYVSLNSGIYGPSQPPLGRHALCVALLHWYCSGPHKLCAPPPPWCPFPRMVPFSRTQPSLLRLTRDTITAPCCRTAASVLLAPLPLPLPTLTHCCLLYNLG